MKKQLVKSLISLCLSLVICAMPAFAANTIAIEDGGISLDVYKDASGNVNEDYVKVTVKYTATPDETAEEMSRITFALSATEPEEKLAGNEAKVVYLDEQVTPTEDSTYSFVIEKSRIQSALNKATLAEIESASLLFKMGGVGVETAAVKEVVYNTPKDTMYGDVNADETIDYSDAILILKHSVGTITLTAQQLVYADVQADGKVDYSDAILALKYGVEAIDYDDILQLRQDNQNQQ